MSAGAGIKKREPRTGNRPHLFVTPDAGCRQAEIGHRSTAPRHIKVVWTTAGRGGECVFETAGGGRGRGNKKGWLGAATRGAA